MEYLTLYRKWRPQGFGDFVGQSHVVRTLRNAVSQNRVAHAYLFAGPRGTGKTTAAKILAKAVNCAAPKDGDPCGECPSCRRITEGISLDVQEIDGASNRGIDEVRDLREKVKFAPAEGRYRVYIIDEVHMLTGEAFNALLKTLEEPPPHVIFIFATTEPHRVPATVLSRCQRFDFKRFGRDEIVARLAQIAAAEGFTVEEGALNLIAVQAAGGMRDAIGLLEQAASHAGPRIAEKDVREVLGLVDREVYHRLALAVRDADPAAALNIVDEVAAAGKDLVQFARGAGFLWRDLLALAVTAGPVPLQTLPPEEAEEWRPLARAIGAERLLAAVELFAATAVEQRRGGEGRLPLEMALLRRTTEIPAAKELAHRLARLEEEVARLAGKGKPAGGEGPPSLAAPLAQGGRHTETKRKEEPPDGLAPDGQRATAEKIVDRWPLVQERLRRVKKSLHALLDQHAWPKGVEGGVFLLGTANEIFAQKIEAERALLEEILTAVYGRPLTIRCRVETRPEKAPARPPADDPVAMAVQLFEGTVEEE
ncbi:MAG: DNA polymerase III subunit gamma/tau [Firmicutes bacterium]|nr:DNA polymerase III subunit gamma/tau [Bacillota bacterium]